MSLIKSAFFAASFAIIGTVSATAQTYDSSRIEAMRNYEWSAQNSYGRSAQNSVSREARRARAEVIAPRQAAPFSRMSLESLTW